MYHTTSTRSGTGDDVLDGGAGDDELWGGGGRDVAVYAGSSLQYGVTQTGPSSFRVYDAIAARDGNDKLQDVERIRFADAELDLSTRVDGWRDGAASVPNEAAAGTLVGKVVASGAANYQGTVRYSLIGSAVDRFIIDEISGDVRLKDALPATGSVAQYDLLIRATFGGVAREFTLPIDVDRAPSALMFEAPVARPSSILGSAGLTSEGWYRLTPDQSDRMGAVWGQVDLRYDTTWTGRLYFGSNDSGADGVSFAIQGASDQLMGATGVLTVDSIGVVFDTYANSGEPNSDFSQIVLGGQPSTTFDSHHLHPNLESGGWHDVVISWKSTDSTLSYSLDNGPVFSKSVNKADLFGTNNAVFYGFGARTGGAFNEQRIDIQSITSLLDQPSVFENAQGGTLVAVLTGRDREHEESTSYAITDAFGAPVTNKFFEMANGAELRVRSGAVIDYEVAKTRELHITSSNDQGASRAVSVAVTIRNVVEGNEAPSDIVFAEPGAGISSLVGSASALGDGVYKLTPNAGGQTGAVWGAVDLTRSVVWTTKMFFGASDAGADGVNFVLQNEGATVLGDAGLSSRSIGIRFDTYVNQGEPGSDYSQFVLNGSAPATTFDQFHRHPNLEDNRWHDVVISWNANEQQLSYSLDGVEVAQRRFDIVGNTFSGSGIGYFGFGARTGGATNEHSVRLLSVDHSTDQLNADSTAPSGTIVGRLSGTDPNNEPLSYIISDGGGTPVQDALFEITPTAEIRIRAGVDLQAYAGTTRDLTVTAFDPSGLKITERISIKIAGSPQAAPQAFSIEPESDVAGARGEGTNALVGSVDRDVLHGTNYTDTIDGNAGNDKIAGFGGDDVLQGGLGDDFLDGGLGSDAALFAGAKTTYSIVTSGGTTMIRDDASGIDGDDGTDTLIGIETVRFNDGSQGIAAPIILDLDGNGVRATDQGRSKTKFDWDSDGKKNATGWVGKGDGLLVLDRNGDGKMSGANELSFVNDKPGAKSDLDGLTAFDSNADGLFSSLDEEWSSFRVWVDKDTDGKVDKKELRLMADVGISSINLAGQAVDRTWNWGETVTVNTGTFTRTDGSTGGFSDVALSYAASPQTRAASPDTGEQFASEIWSALYEHRIFETGLF
ncbi:hypothetical protein [uncultured Sphingomonas sp.]|uniref:lectin-like domain-containing protein n=1 Tax=uncultured Sphingomonas sp. TaxID=158754 RepID=UPI0035CBC3EA